LASKAEIWRATAAEVPEEETAPEVLAQELPIAPEEPAPEPAIEPGEQAPPIALLAVARIA
jgi:hypothetical protein